MPPPPTLVPWRRGTLASERGGGRVPIPTRGHTLWYSIYLYVICGYDTGLVGRVVSETICAGTCCHQKITIILYHDGIPRVSFPFDVTVVTF